MRDPWIRLLRIGAEEDAIGLAQNVFRSSMRIPDTWRPFVAARHSQRKA